MVIIDDARNWVKEVALECNGLAGSALDTPLIGNWCYVALNTMYADLMHLYIGLTNLSRWADGVETRLGQILSWSTIAANIRGTWTFLDSIDDRIRSTAGTWIRGTWSWIDTIDDRIWSTASSRIRSAWSWIDTIDDRIWSTASANIRSTWSFLDTIEDKIRTSVRAEWAFLDSIDDRIKDVAWNHVAAKMGDWLLAWILANLTLGARIGYRVLDAIWNMEWDDQNKEAK